jgi:hypothetical protein
MNLKTIALGAIVLFAVAGCSKDPAPAVTVAPAPTAVPAGSTTAPPAGTASTSAPAAPGAAPTGNPEASKDPVFNMPAQPVLDASKAKAELDKIKADALK